MRFRSAIAASVLFLGIAAAHGYQLGDLTIGHPSASPTAPGQPNGAAYLTVETAGAGPDRLIGLETPAAAAAEIHAMSDEGGVMSMRKLDSVEIAPGAPVHFQPGGLHIMLIGLIAPLEAGKSVPLTLTFEKAGVITVDLAIEKPAEPAAHGDHNH
ncbi:MAG: copper chaperone PCu(A)C [Micropepsaceae bacterium]